MAFYTISPFIGPVVGPLLSGYGFSTFKADLSSAELRLTCHHLTGSSIK